MDINGCAYVYPTLLHNLFCFDQKTKREYTVYYQYFHVAEQKTILDIRHYIHNVSIKNSNAQPYHKLTQTSVLNGMKGACVPCIGVLWLTTLVVVISAVYYMYDKYTENYCEAVEAQEKQKKIFNDLCLDIQQKELFIGVLYFFLFANNDFLFRLVLWILHIALKSSIIYTRTQVESR